MPLKDASGETEVHIFYKANTLDGVTDTTKRPVFLLQRGTRAGVDVGAHGPDWAAQPQT